MMANAKAIHTIPFTSAHMGLIILGLGISRKSAPLIPKLTETILNENTKKTASLRHNAANLADGIQIALAITEQANVTQKEKSKAKEYLTLTRFFAEMGDA